MEPIKGKKPSKILIAGVAAVVLAVAVIVAGLSVSSGSREYKDHLEMAQKYLDELDYEQAVVELRMAIEIEPNNGEAYFALAEVYVAMEDYESALAVLEEGYAATGDEAFLEEKERMAGEYAKWQEQKAEQEEREQEQRLEAFYEKYADLYHFAMDEVFSGSRGYFDRYLTFAEREEVYGGLAEQLEEYLADFNGMSEELYDDDGEVTAYGTDYSVKYFTRTAAYRYLADTYLRMGKLEECLRVRTEWAAFCDRPDLVQDGNHGYDEYEYVDYEYDRYGRMTGYYSEGGNGQSTYTYGEAHDGATHWVETLPGELWEDDYTYDSEGRIQHWHRVITREGEGVTVIDHEYTYQGDHSYVTTGTTIRPNGSTDVYQSEKRFYDEYGRDIY